MRRYSASEPSQYTTRSGLVSLAASSTQFCSGVATLLPLPADAFAAKFHACGARREAPRDARSRSEMESAMPLGLRKAGIHRPGGQAQCFYPKTSLCYGSPVVQPRSEEHTSELQSRRDLVCRLLLEK